MRLKGNTEYGSSVAFNAIDVTKFICALLVVTVHIAPFNDDGAIILKYLNFGVRKYLARIAVPFFFVCSGFFLFRQIENSENRRTVIENYCFRLIRLLGLWSIVLTENIGFHLWYVGASVVAIGVASLLLKWNIKYRYMILVAAGLYILGLLGDSYYGLIEELVQIQPFKFLDGTYRYFFSNTQNGVFMGFPFFLCGMLFARGKIRINKVIALIGFLVSEILLFFEVFLLEHFEIAKDYNMFIFLIPATIFLFALVSNIQLKDRPVYKKLRVAGVLVYFSHLLVYKMVHYVAAIVQKTLHLDLSNYLFWITLLCAVGIAFLIEYLSHKKKFKWLNWLYR